MYDLTAMRKAISENHNHAASSNLARINNPDGEIQPSSKSPCLPDLVWKHFEAEIREALFKAQESLADDNDERDEQLSNRKQVGE
ncbi:MAG: hypothetical protein ACTHLX_07240 [Candidatus Binatia bacterium]